MELQGLVFPFFLERERALGREAKGFIWTIFHREEIRRDVIRGIRSCVVKVSMVRLKYDHDLEVKQPLNVSFLAPGFTGMYEIPACQRSE